MPYLNNGPVNVSRLNLTAIVGLREPPSIVVQRRAAARLKFFGSVNNESTMGADASVEALKLYHMKLAYSILALHASDSSWPVLQKMGNDRRDRS